MDGCSIVEGFANPHASWLGFLPRLGGGYVVEIPSRRRWSFTPPATVAKRPAPSNGGGSFSLSPWERVGVRVFRAITPGFRRCLTVGLVVGARDHDVRDRLTRAGTFMQVGFVAGTSKR